MSISKIEEINKKKITLWGLYKLAQTAVEKQSKLYWWQFKKKRLWDEVIYQCYLDIRSWRF